MKYFAGADLGGTNTAVGIVDEKGTIIAQVSERTDVKFEKTVEKIARLTHLAAEKANIPYDDIEAIGVGVPGAIGEDGSKVIFAPNMEWDGVPFGKTLSELAKKPVFLANDADCAMLAEVVCGGAKGKNSAVMLTLGTGVGGGVYLNGRLFKGCTPGGTELGHMTLVYDGEKCSCGRRGCIEMYASANALKRQTMAAMKKNPQSLMWKYAPNMEKVNGMTAFKASYDGDETAIEVVRQYTDYVATAISGFVNVFRPEIVLIGGGISNEGESFLKPLDERTAELCFASDFILPPKVVAATMGNEAGIIGAAMICME